VSSLPSTLGDLGHVREGLVSARAVRALPSDTVSVARALGLLPAQFGATRDGAIQADLDVPDGFWRIWPESGFGVWVGRAPNQPPPSIPSISMAGVDLAQAILRLGESGIWLFEGRILRHGSGWTNPLALSDAYGLLMRSASDMLAIDGWFGDSSGRSHHGVLSRDGELQAVSPTQAVRWLMTIYAISNV
jgi:hypothetical protein